MLFKLQNDQKLIRLEEKEVNLLILYYKNDE